MKLILKIWVLIFLITLVSCSGSSKSKRGCPASDANLGAERVMAGEGKKKPSKFKIKDMNKSY